MYAMRKGKAAQYFHKKQKPKEDIEKKMNNLEAYKIASSVGISQFQFDRFDWFFEQIKKLKLPKNYTRHLNTDGTKVIYQNQKTQQKQQKHPIFNLIKIFLYQTLNNNRNYHTFQQKQSKLLPYVEEKMLKQCIGLSSKRRDAEKVNLKRDENGKMVLSKLARITPDLHSLVSSRSYMLKMLVQKVFTKKQIWGKGKKAGIYTQILQNYNSNKKKQQKFKQGREQEENEITLEKYQNIFQQACQYYQKEFGNVTNIPQACKYSPQYLNGNPEVILSNIYLLNINKSNIQLYWFARLMSCLPVPPNWILQKNNEQYWYVYEPEQLTFDIHPSYIYIVKQLNQFRGALLAMKTTEHQKYLSFRQMLFYDYFEREYKVDIYGFIEEKEKEQIKMMQIKQKNQNKIDHINDWLIMEGIYNCNIQPQNYHLIEEIQNYWKKINWEEQKWKPVASSYGQIIWSSTINKKSIGFCPFQIPLTNFINSKIQQVPTLQNSNLKQQFNNMIKEPIQQEKNNFLQHYIRNDPKPLSKPYEIQLELLHQQSFYENIFWCPFNLQEGLIDEDGQVPLWLQKVRAKRDTQISFRTLDFEQNSFENIRQKYKDLIYKVTQKHEPNKVQEYIDRVQGCQQISELKQYIIYINDIDARQLRKQQARKDAAQDYIEKEQDLFGSDLSQIDIENQVQEEEEEEDADQSSSQTSEKHQESQIYTDKQSSSHMIHQIAQEEEDSTIELKQRQKQSIENIFKVNYKKNQDLQKASDNQLNVQLIKKMKKNKKKHKYSQKIGSPNLQSNIFQTKGKDYTKIRRIKQNLIITDMRNRNLPYQISIEPIQQSVNQIRNYFKNRGCFTPQFERRSESFMAYESQMQDYGNEDIDREIRKYRKKQIFINQSDSQQQLQIQSNIKKDKIKKPSKERIILTPIKQFKPSISHDPVLRHIKQIKQFQQFSKIFKNDKQIDFANRKSLSTIRKKAKDISTDQQDSQSKLQSEINIEKKMTTSYSINKLSKSKYTKDSSIKQFDKKKSSIGKSILPLTQIRKSDSKLNGAQSKINAVKGCNIATQTQRIFSRVCLGNTASHFLSTDSLTRKGDLIVLEARKTLMNKGRGLETYVSKKY